MKITAILRQIKRQDRYSVFVDQKYTFSLSEGALLTSKLANGQTISQEELNQYKNLSSDDKLYNMALKLVLARPKTEGELRFYLKRKGASPALIDSILNKLTNIDLINDLRYAQNFINYRAQVRPASRRKIINDLRKRFIKDEVINQAFDKEGNDQPALAKIIEQRRRQTKYQDNNKLMQYLARQGFSYQDIKDALKQADEG